MELRVHKKPNKVLQNRSVLSEEHNTGLLREVKRFLRAQCRQEPQGSPTG